jgi:DNA primase
VGILDEDVVRVREATDFVAIASQFMQLKKVGRSYSGLCPFHGEKTPSFSVDAERGLWYCFGCQKRGDVITFVRELEHLDFVEAVEYLAAKAGITLTYTEAREGESRKEKQKLQAAMRDAVEWYHQRLLTSPDAGTARKYLRERGLSGDEVRAYRIGWAPDDWDALAKALKLPEQVLKDTGLGFVNARNKKQDFFRARVLFPIFDPQGEPVAFGGRKLPDTEGPKYRNSSETKLYSKSKVLYGLNWAKDEVVRADEVIVCEGYTDVIGFAAAGVPRAVATCGTALTEDHVRLLKRFARKLVLAFDPDAAGQAAAERVYEWEKKLDIDVGIADLPAGEDPGDLSRSDPDRLRKAAEENIPFLGFRVERALQAGNLSTPEGRARTAEAALAVIAEHPDELVRDQYVMQVADRSRIDIERLRASLRAGGRASLAEAPTQRSATSGGGRAASNERRILRLAVDAERGAETLALLDEVLFVEDRYLRAYRLLRDAGGDLHAAIADADPALADGLQRMAVEETIDEPRDIRRALLREAGARCLADLERTARTSDDPAPWVAAIRWLQSELHAIREEARPGQEVEDQLLAWLSEQCEERA